jgi:hypothetical protein
MSRLAGGKTPESVLQYLRDVHYPARKDQIVHAARTKGAPNDIVGALGQLPANEFDSPEKVLEAYPKIS